MVKALGVMLIVLGTAGSALAFTLVPVAPEIDPSSAGSALALLTGGLLVVRGLRKR